MTTIQPMRNLFPAGLTSPALVQIPKRRLLRISGGIDLPLELRAEAAIMHEVAVWATYVSHTHGYFPAVVLVPR